MSVLIEGSIGEGGRVVDDRWITVDTADALAAAPADAAVIVPLSLWRAAGPTLAARTAPLGLLLAPDVDLDPIASDLERIAMIAIEFPKFTDGRGYSVARLLRERYGYRGSLRAVGDVLRDQIFYLLRCGFDAFAMKHATHVDSALAAYRDFSDAYQTSVDRPLPLFARRRVAEVA